MIRILLRTLAAFVLGLVTSFVGIFAVEVVSGFLHPFPTDFQGTHEEVCAHVAKYPNGILAGVVVAWSVTVALGTWVAQRLGNLYASIALGVLLTAGVALNISMLPYPNWFEMVIMVAIPLSAIAGMRLAMRKSAPTATLGTVLESPT